ncbi:hypothetical protein [Agaribacterium sp. ZY112]|uniref:hypothetical protein n=1 Tax=Agaribacterium sp. ZY112 TaxID=3233574 RepID=UPI003525115D
MDNKLLKDEINATSVKKLAALFTDLACEFDAMSFSELALTGLDQLSLKQRVFHIVHALKQVLSVEYLKITQLFDKLSENQERNKTLTAFEAWPLIEFIGLEGIEQPELALPCLAKLTHLFSAEFAIRPYLEKHEALCFTFFEAWLGSKDEHIRRLISEGTRPRLPWGAQLTKYRSDPVPLEAFLRALSTDDSLYVRRSVANNLNDIGKDNPEWLIDTCESWLARDLEPELAKRCLWVIKHGLRSLVKLGNSKALRLLGYHGELEKAELSLSGDRVSIGASLELVAHLLCGAEAGRFVIDYSIAFVKKNGSVSSKVFKWKNVELDPGEKLELSKKQSFKVLSTRQYYSGLHQVSLLVNGDVKAQAIFDLST